jgi:hypothetical protein
MPRSKDGHYTLYTMNRYRETIDIHDTRRYTGAAEYTTKWRRSEYHGDCTEVVCHVFLISVLPKIFFYLLCLNSLHFFCYIFWPTAKLGFLVLHFFNRTVTTLLVHTAPHLLVQCTATSVTKNYISPIAKLFFVSTVKR